MLSLLLPAGLLALLTAGCVSVSAPKMSTDKCPDIGSPRRVAVLPFGDAPGADAGRSGQVVAGALVDAVRRNTGWQVIERANLSALKDEYRLATDGFLSPSSAAKVGRLLGAQEVIVGNVSQYEIGSIPFFFFLVLDMNVYRIGYSFRIVDTETGEVKWTGSTSASSTKSLEACAAEATKKVFDVWTASPKSLPPPEPASVPEVKGGGEGFALVIGINKYDQLGELNNCRQDASELATLLRNRGGYSEDRVLLQTDEDQGRASFASLTRRIGLVCKLAGPDDVLLIYFSGHGITIDGQGYLVPSDGLEAQTCISIKWLQAQMVASKAKAKVMILDACHSGSAVRGVEGITPSMINSEGLITITSCADSELSYPEGQHGAFSSFLLSGLGGKADVNNDGQVTHLELFSYIQGGMKSWCFKNGKTQSPQLFAPRALDIPLATVAPSSAR